MVDYSTLKAANRHDVYIGSLLFLFFFGDGCVRGVWCEGFGARVYARVYARVLGKGLLKGLFEGFAARGLLRGVCLRVCLRVCCEGFI